MFIVETAPPFLGPSNKGLFGNPSAQSPQEAAAREEAAAVDALLSAEGHRQPPGDEPRDSRTSWYISAAPR